MTVKELHSILDTIPYGILTYDNSDYEFQAVRLHSLSRIDINFLHDNFVVCFIKVLGNHTIHTCYYEDDTEKPEYKNCFTAMHNTKTYLEILGFKTV